MNDQISGKIITVIGGGPAGMAAAISAARQGAGTVRLLEKNGILGRKLLATGNGRCNLTNINCRDAKKTLEFFGELGLLTRTEAEGRVYPYSEQASAVQEALIKELEHLKVEIRCGMEAKSIEKADSGFRIITDKERLFTNRVILAAGGKAGPQYGSTGDGYRFARAFGHRIVSIRPSLVQMVSEEKYFKSLKGVRAKGLVKLMRGNEIVDQETGEIQFTEDGVSGICVFNLSKAYMAGDIIKIDFFAEYSEELLIETLAKRACTLSGRTVTDYFAGILNKKLIPVILDLIPLDGNGKAEGLGDADFLRITKFLKGLKIPVSGTKGWKEAQVTAGGVDLAEVNKNTAESLLVPGLYFAGELLDVDEKCGGYNLQWAWMSGLTAGASAAKG